MIRKLIKLDTFELLLEWPYDPSIKTSLLNTDEVVGLQWTTYYCVEKYKNRSILSHVI